MENKEREGTLTPYQTVKLANNRLYYEKEHLRRQLYDMTTETLELEDRILELTLPSIPTLQRQTFPSNDLPQLPLIPQPPQPPRPPSCLLPSPNFKPIPEVHDQVTQTMACDLFVAKALYDKDVARNPILIEENKKLTTENEELRTFRAMHGIQCQVANRRDQEKLKQLARIRQEEVEAFKRFEANYGFFTYRADPIGASFHPMLHHQPLPKPQLKHSQKPVSEILPSPFPNKERKIIGNGNDKYNGKTFKFLNPPPLDKQMQRIADIPYDDTKFLVKLDYRLDNPAGVPAGTEEYHLQFLHTNALQAPITTAGLNDILESLHS